MAPGSAGRRATFAAVVDRVAGALEDQTRACLDDGPGMEIDAALRADLDALAGMRHEELVRIAGDGDDADPAALVAYELLEEDVLRRLLDDDGDEGAEEDGDLLAMIDGDGFDLAPLEDRCAALDLDDPDLPALAHAIAALAVRPGYDPLGPDPWDPEVIAATTAGLAVSSAVTLATHLCDHDHDPDDEVHGRVRALADVAIRACSALRGEERRALLSPWSAPTRMLRRSLAVLDLGAAGSVRAAALMPLLLHAGAGGNWARVSDGPGHLAIDEDSLRAIEHTLAELDPDARRDAFSEDPILLAVALGHSWARWDTGPGWIAPWDPAWNVMHARTH